MTTNHVSFPIYPKHSFHPWKLHCPNILKNPINFPFFHPFLKFSMGLVLGTSPHFVAIFFAPTSTSSVMHSDALQTIAPPPPSLEEPTQ
jgi:hypothetical protein